MPLIVHVLLFLIFVSSFISESRAQEKDTFIVRTTFANQGEQEDYWAEKLFHETYKEELYKRFAGDIILMDKNQIRFGNKVVHACISPEYKSIFTEGIFYPQIISGDAVTPKKSTEEINKMSVEQRLFYNMNQNDTLSVGDFEELKFLSKSPTIKRFRFWNYSKAENPQVFFIELTNRTADKFTDLQTFIKSARLTFVKAGWIIL